MNYLMAVYECPRCGDVLEDETFLTVQPIRRRCSNCNREVQEKTRVFDGEIRHLYLSVDYYRYLNHQRLSELEVRVTIR